MEGGVCAAQFGKTWSKKCAFGLSVDFSCVADFNGLDIVSIFLKLKRTVSLFLRKALRVTFQINP